jgi:hypothetical protein
MRGLEMSNEERADIIVDAQEAILEAVESIRQAVRGTEHEDQVERQVLAHIVCSTTSDHGWLDRSTNLDDVIRWFGPQECEWCEEEMREGEGEDGICDRCKTEEQERSVG